MRAVTHPGRDPGARRHYKVRLTVALVLTGALLIGAAWTGQAWAQERLARVGILSFLPMTEDSTWWTTWMELFRRNLAQQGWIEGKTVSFDYRSANGDPSQFAGAAAELVEMKVDVIWATSAPAIRAAQAATRTIPIVGWDFTTDPIAEGYIQSYARPGGNLTGVFLDAPEFAGKWFELLKATFPDLSRVAVVWDPAPGTTHLQAVRSAAGSLDVELQII
ncbi:MAG: hypothetical protein JSU95_03905, partial [Betaproteobacteria bacterium]